MVVGIPSIPQNPIVRPAAFFSMPVDISTRIALATGAPIVPLSLVRDKANFTMTVHEPIEIENTGDRTKDVEAGVLKINAFIENRIQENPSQWFWVHRRWPKEIYK